jgi:predicted O-methyltransferase YrrM
MNISRGMSSRAMAKPMIRMVRRRLDAAARRRIQSNATLWPLLQDYLAKSESTGCQYIDYDVLYRQIRALKPMEVLECGTGVSTVVVAQALRENAAEHGIEGRVTSMEDLEPWYEMAVRLLPEELVGYTDLRLSPKVEAGYTIFRGVRYAEVPKRRYDFMFIDGPGTLAPSDRTRSCDFDFVDVVRQSDHPVSAVIDGRLTSCYVLQQIFGREKVRFNVYENLGYVGPCSRHDMKTITRSSSKALSHSLRLVSPTRFRLEMEPPPLVGESEPSE